MWSLIQIDDDFSSHFSSYLKLKSLVARRDRTGQDDIKDGARTPMKPDQPPQLLYLEQHTAGRPAGRPAVCQCAAD